MALTITKKEDHSLGSLRGVIATVTFDASYASGGEVLLPQTLGLGQILMLNIVQGEDGYVIEWDSANNKLLVRQGPTSVGILPEVGAIDLSAVVVEVFAIGR